MKTYNERKHLIYNFMKEPLYVPMKEKELAVVLQVEPEDREQLKRVLCDLLEEGKIDISKRGRYSIAAPKLVRGSFVMHPKGFGFLECEDSDDRYYIPPQYAGDAFHGDVVEGCILPGTSGKSREAKIVRVISHTVTSVVGTYEESGTSGRYGFVLPDDKRITCDIFISPGHEGGARDGQKVVCDITDYGRVNKKPEGIITEIIGFEDDPGVDVISIAKAFGIREVFDEHVLKQADNVAKPVSAADMAGREDLRDVLMVTIDGEDARDLDDAVSLSVEEDIYELGVHIADVANYVQENSALDREALLRGTSVYLPGAVIPMLPQKLSNGICSLNQGEDRLALSCIMKIDDEGRVTDYRIVESVICVNHRMSYNQVKGILSGGDCDTTDTSDSSDTSDISCACGDVHGMIIRMGKLAGILKQRRIERGSIDFDFPESRIVLDEQGNPTDIKPYEHNAATNLIEEFMLLANETVAQHFYWQEIPFLYRVHEAPDRDKLIQLAVFIANFGYSIKPARDDLHPKEIQKLLCRIEGTGEETLISRIALRSMKKACYSVQALGHFGLSCRYYSHFTSPIRRYPDLQIHRIIKETIRGRYNPEREAHYIKLLPGVAKASSKAERTADEAEREAVKLKKVRYMENFYGEVFEGVISGIAEHGIYVELPNTVEGLISVRDLGSEYYVFDPDNYLMKGRKTGKTYRLGQKIRVCLKNTDRKLRHIDFIPFT